MQIHAEVTADHGQIVLVAGGDPEEMAAAAKQLTLLTPLFTKSDPPGALTTPLTWPAVVQLQAALGQSWRPGHRLCAWIEREVASRTGSSTLTPAGLSYRAPDGLTPYPWQTEGAAIITATGRALITDEPGTGKTITTILGLIERDGSLEQGPVLVVCPASVVDHWVAAWRAWAPHVCALAWRGSPRHRSELAGQADVYVASYETVRQDAPPSTSRKLAPLLGLDLAGLVLDECHLVKNHQTARSQAARRIARGVAVRGGAVVALSGTPITHHPGDLWASLDALEHDAWPSRERWIRRYCTTLPGDYREEILGLAPAAEPEFRLTLLGQHRRVAKADVLDQLPPKVYSVRTVDLPPIWRKVYDDFESAMLAELPRSDGGVAELSVMDVMSKFGHLSRLACAAADVEVTYGPDVDEQTGEPKRHVHLDLKAPSWKVDALLELLAERPGAPVVAFTPSRQLALLAGAAAAAEGLRVGYVVGGQPASGPDSRTETVDAFQAGRLDLICATTGAGGVGLTLTAAGTVVFLSRPWSLVESLQAEDRCHRIGSERHDSIEIVDVVARNTIDTRVRAVLRERAGQLADLVQDPRIVSELLGGVSASGSARHKQIEPSTLPGVLNDRALERTAS